MSAFEDLDLHPDIINKLIAAEVPNLEWLIFHSLADIQRKAKLSRSHAENVRNIAMKCQYSMKSLTVSNLLSNSINRLPTGCHSIDKILGGGLLCQGITELTGESACGKTQICMQTALYSQIIRRNNSLCNCLFICTEDVFPSQRLVQLENYLKTKNGALRRHRFCSNIYIEHCSDLYNLMGLLENKVPHLLKKGQTNLIIIDSITALFRGQEKENSAINKSKDIGDIGLILHQLSYKYNICILCVNQVTANMNPCSSEKSLPALGLTWANLVTTRLQVRRATHESPIRTFSIEFSPHLPCDCCEYTITSEGVTSC